MQCVTARVTAALAISLVLAAGCGQADGVSGGNANTAPLRLEVLSGTYLEPSSTGSFALNLQETADGFTAEVRVAGARALKAACLALRYDPQKYVPAGTTIGPALASASPDAKLIVLAVTSQPGAVYIGQVLPGWDHQEGYSGDGLIACVKFRRGAAPPYRAARIAPDSAASAPAVGYDEATSEMSWRFANQGDCNQDGAVSLSDLTPLGLYFNQSVAPGEENTAKAVADCDGNGLINLGDITPIGQNFGCSVNGGWHIYRSLNAADYPSIPTDDNGGAILTLERSLDSYDPSMSTTADRVLYTCTLSAPAVGERIWVRGADSAGIQGIASNMITITSVNEPPDAHLSADPVSGPPSLTVAFDATGSVDPDGTIVKWRWDPDGNGIYMILPPSNPGSPTLNYSFNTPGAYHATVKVWDDKGATGTASVNVVASLGSLETEYLDLNGGVESVGTYASMKIVNGMPVVAYFNASYLCVDFVRPFTSAGDGWCPPVTIGGDAYGFISLADINNRPCVVYMAGSFELRFARAKDADGIEWNTPVALTGYGSNWFPSLANVAGRPAIAYNDGSYGFGGGDIYFRRAEDSIGSSWGAPMQVNPDFIPAGMSSLIVVSGNPAVMYSAITSMQPSGIFYNRAINSDGSSWDNGHIVMAGGTPTVSLTDFAVVAGLPAVAYWSEEEGKLYFIRAEDIDGGYWHDPVAVCDAAGTEFHSSLAVVGGLPAIAFSDSTRGIMYVQARTSTGSLWNTPVVMDPEGGCYLSLQPIESRGAVAYWAPGNQLKLAVFREY